MHQGFVQGFHKFNSHVWELSRSSGSQFLHFLKKLWSYYDLCVCVWYQCRAGDTLKPPFTTHNPVCSTPAKVYAKLSQFAVISGHCALVGAWVSMQTAILCWWELALACATQHPPHSSILHTNVPQASSHTANVQMRCLVIYSMYTFDTSAKKSSNLGTVTCLPGTCHCV